jgi:hypothetical protein
MTEEELKTKMLAFVDQQDNSYEEEWWCTPRALYAGVIKEFAAHLGIDFAAPHKEKTPPPNVNRQEILQSLLPEIQKQFGLEYKKHEHP